MREFLVALLGVGFFLAGFAPALNELYGRGRVRL